ncbi:MAG TPA: hypothetical protein RMH99_25905 [Sandaracinaceae bacterium LLY-WYZ-13_1]|nr:hypothetical protein [Sandaracinaceae bacterium LLY-WYZ-13_1]
MEDGACVPCPAHASHEPGDDMEWPDAACECDPGFGGDGITECIAGVRVARTATGRALLF